LGEGVVQGPALALSQRSSRVIRGGREESKSQLEGVSFSFLQEETGLWDSVSNTGHIPSPLE
jgi:hypothetical protein